MNPKIHLKFKLVQNFHLNIILCYIGSQDSPVDIATGYGLDGGEVGVRVPVVSSIFTFPYRPDRLWPVPSLLSNGY
jgi:hypothetical protein